MFSNSLHSKNHIAQAQIAETNIAIKSWQLAASSCSERLEDVDRQSIHQVSRRELFLPEFIAWRKSLPNSCRMVASSLEPFPLRVTEFEEYVEGLFQKQVTLGPFWGMTLLALQLASETVYYPSNASSITDNVLSRVSQMLETMAANMQKILLVRLDDVSNFVEIYKALFRILEQAILSLRKGISYDLRVHSWPEVEERFRAFVEQVSFCLNIFSQNNRAWNTPSVVPEIQEHLESPPPQSTVAERISSKTPHTVILPAKNVRFCGRTDIMKEIDLVIKQPEIRLKNQEQRDAEPLPGIKSTVLYGLGGVGKTEIAREYAYRAEPNCDAVFWIPSESSMSIQEAFTNAALRLNLEGAKENEHQKNGHIIMKWLESTTRRWLLVFNNVDEAGLLSGYWPSIGRGSILITTRNAKPFFTMIKSKIEVRAFSDDEGPQCLLSLAGQEDVSPTELAAAKRLSKLLGGHALGISQIAALIRSRMISIAEGLELYQDFAHELHDAEGQPTVDSDTPVDLTTLWALQFSGLDKVKNSDAKSLMAVMAYISPDGISSNIFNLRTRTVNGATKERPRFCINTPMFFKAETTLLDLSLIQKTAGTKQLSVHRLLQVEFRYHMKPNERQTGFENATTLLSLVFPKQIKGQAMHKDWTECQLWSAHVISLAQRYMEVDDKLSNLKPNLEFCEVLSNCAWYLRERAALELDDLLAAGLKACKEIMKGPDVEIIKEPGVETMKDPGLELIYAHLCNTASAWDDDRGFFQRAEPRFLECLKIRRKYLDPNDDELSGTLHNISLNYLMTMDFEKCLSYRDQSMQIIEQMPAGRVRELKTAKRTYVLGYCQALQGNSQARLSLVKALSETQRLKDWYMTALTYCALGRLSYTENKFSDSEAEFQSAEKVVIDAGRQDDFRMMIGIKYYLAKTAMAQDYIVRAVKLLLEAYEMGEEYQSMAEKSRMLWMFSRALKRLPPNAQLLDEFRNNVTFATLDSEELEKAAVELLQRRCPDLDLTNGIREDMFLGLIHVARL